MLEREVEKLLKVHYADMPGLDTETQMLFKQLECVYSINCNYFYLFFHDNESKTFVFITEKIAAAIAKIFGSSEFQLLSSC